MGNGKATRGAVLAAQPNCIYCGGAAPATTVDHCPPRTIFDRRQWPDGYCFSSCERCNKLSARLEMLIAMLSHFDPDQPEASLEEQARRMGLYTSIRHHFPGLLEEMFNVSAAKVKRTAKELGLVPEPGQTYADLPLAKVPARLETAVGVFAAKIAKALHYHHTGRIIPAGVPARFQWFTSADIMRNIPWIDEVAAKLGSRPILKRSGQDLSDQFDYLYALSEDGAISVFRVIFGKAFGLFIFNTINPKIFDQVSEGVRRRTGSTSEPMKAIFYPPIQS